MRLIEQQPKNSRIPGQDLKKTNLVREIKLLPLKLTQAYCISPLRSNTDGDYKENRNK